MPETKFRLVTRSDMDGLVCAVLLKHIDMVNDILFVHPKDMQDGTIEITDNDIITNLPYVEKAHLVFDHHSSEKLRVKGDRENHVIDTEAPSAARVVYDYYGGAEKFPASFEPMMLAVDKADAAQFSKDDILDPQGWELLSFLMDARTGLGRFRDFRISNYELMMTLIDHCMEHQDINDILELPDVKERVETFREQEPLFKEQIKRCSTEHNNLVVLDLRDEDTIYCGNRFMIYALYPDCNISMHVLWGRQKQNTVFAVGKSIFDRSSDINIGALMLKNGGGGHEAAGTCQVDNDACDTVQQNLISEMSGG